MSSLRLMIIEPSLPTLKNNKGKKQNEPINCSQLFNRSPHKAAVGKNIGSSRVDVKCDAKVFFIKEVQCTRSKTSNQKEGGMSGMDLVGALELARTGMRGMEELGPEYRAAQEILCQHLGQVRLLGELLANQLGEKDACLGLDVIEALVMAAPVGFLGSLVADKKRSATGGMMPQDAGVCGAVEGDGEGPGSGERGGVHAGSVATQVEGIKTRTMV
jgi:hypothetical protein